MLYCPGIPGAGKTVLSSMVIEHLQQEYGGTATPILFAYCNYKDSGQQSAVNLIGSLLRQLLDLHADSLESLESLYESHHYGETRRELEELEEIFHARLRRFPQSFVIVDALDKCLEETTRSEFLRILQELEEGSQA